MHRFSLVAHVLMVIILGGSLRVTSSNTFVLVQAGKIDRSPKVQHRTADRSPKVQHRTADRSPKVQHRTAGHGGLSNGVAPSLQLPPVNHGSISPVVSRKIFNVLSYGAKGDGIGDDTMALSAAWKAACKVAGATVEIPSGFKFFVMPITLQGPCMPHLVLQIDGTLMAPPRTDSWPKSRLYEWINLKWAHNFTIQGNGTVDGQGYEWWSSSLEPTAVDHIMHRQNKKPIPHRKPTAIRFYAGHNVTVRDISIINSPLCHLKFDNCDGVRVDAITVTSPGDSPNTDGIHLQNTRHVSIQHTNIAAGDDCVSIQTGCSNIHIHHLHCGPGHGISIGSLGKDKSVACVSDIVVDHISLQNTLTGVRIKTWQGGIGTVKNISFTNIRVSNVKIPIVIDQFYCDRGRCKNQTGGVAISNIVYNQIIGTYASYPIHLACNGVVPCTGIDLTDIQLNPSPGNNNNNHHRHGGGIQQQTLCSNTYGISRPPLIPSAIDSCFRRGTGGDLSKGLQNSYDNNACMPIDG